MSKTTKTAKPTEHQLRQLASWVNQHGLMQPAIVTDGAVQFHCHDGQPHRVTTMRAAREALGY